MGDFKPQDIEKARTRFAHEMLDNETPLLFYDSSPLHNGSSGCLITTRAIYTSHSSPSCIPLDQVATVKIEKPKVTAFGLGSMPHLIINGHYILYTCEPPDFIQYTLRLLMMSQVQENLKQQASSSAIQERHTTETSSLSPIGPSQT